MVTSFTPTQELPAILSGARALLKECAPSEELFVHGRDVANLLLRWGAGCELAAATLLHEIVYKGLCSIAQVREACGEEVALLCAEYRNRFPVQPPNGWRGNLDSLQRVRFYAVAHYKPALALLCVAHMWHSAAYVSGGNPRPLNTSMALQRPQVRSVLVPVLEMMGMRDLLDQLAANPHLELNPPMSEEDRLLFPAIVDVITGAARGAGSRGQMRVSPRETPFLSTERMSPSERIVDRSYQYPGFYVEVVVPTVADCYGVLYRLNTRFRPLDGTMIDTVAHSRGNGQRSLQAGVKLNIQERSVRVNVQIVTPEMDSVNRWGVALFALPELCESLDLRKPVENEPYAWCWWNRSRAMTSAILAAPPGSPLVDPVIVFSPQGDPFAFARGASVVDFAYTVHSELAEQAQRFFVNGESVEPATVLRHLDLVEMELNPRALGPTSAWLNAARTKRARSLIRRHLRKQSDGASAGQRIVEARLTALEEYYGFHIPEHRVEEAIARGARIQALQSKEELLAEFAAGRIAVDRFLTPLFSEEIVRRVELPRTLRLRPHQIHMAQCCKARPGDDIVGLPYRRGGVLTRVTVHRRDCHRLQIMPAEVAGEAVELRWRLRQQARLLAHIDMVAMDDDGLLGAAVKEFYAMLPRVNLLHCDASARKGTARLRFSFEAESTETVEEIADALRRLPNREVSSVRLFSLSPSEEEALQADGLATNNPYSRMPVHDPTMFFGRSAELERLNEWLRNNVSCIWLRGQKRVGKTSLLLHLRNNYWEPRESVSAFVDFQLLSDLAGSNLFYELASAIYTDLNRDPRIAALGAPDRTLFAQDPPLRLANYLRDLQQRLQTRRLVVLMDEFSRVTDLYLQGTLTADFFQQWRGLLQTTSRYCAFVAVVQQKTYEHIVRLMRTNPADPAWHLLELGETLLLRPFGDDDARRLIEWPMRNYMEFDPGTIECVMELTGGSPFLIQAFCNKLMAQLVRRGDCTVQKDDIEVVAEEFMQPAESIFAHLLDLAPGLANTVMTQMAMAGEVDGYEIPAQPAVGTPAATMPGRNSAARRTVIVAGVHGELTWQQIRTLMPTVQPASLRNALNHLHESDILVESAPDTWRFNSTLFRRWLARNPWDGWLPGENEA